jgi:dienelactone hydrolase
MRAALILGLALCASLPLLEASVHADPPTLTRADHVRNNNEGSDFRPPATKKEWLDRRQRLREQILVACGLYPMPKKSPLSPRVYGKIQRDGYTIEKVVLETLPGFYLSGNLYRPTAAQGRVPGILNPHGHWAEGRIAADVQARCASQARMGGVAFLYDMVGYVDSKEFGHAFMDDELLALGMNLPGLQLWNSIRALDWLTSLPDVDPKRIACTGESGGGTQTFLLCAVDDRIAVSAPVCMVSHYFQGGCTCENAPLLRIGTDNVEIAACFAPKPQLLVGATGDWTAQILQRGVPEIRATYELFGVPDRLQAVVHDAGHNYNQKSRESVYTFFRQHLWGEAAPAPVHEAPFTAEDEKTLSTWDEQHPRPAAAVDPAALKAALRRLVEQQSAGLAPGTAGGWQSARRTLRTALSHLLACNTPKPADLSAQSADEGRVKEWNAERLILTDRGSADRCEALFLTPPGGRRPRRIAVVAHPGGSKGALADRDGAALIEGLLRTGHSVLLVEPFLAGQPQEVAKRQSAPFFNTYNRTVLAQRVQEIVDAAAFARGQAAGVHLIGLGAAGPWVLLARPFCAKVEKTAVDADRWDWPSGFPPASENALPAAGRYGGMRSFAALAAAEGPLYIHNTGGAFDASWAEQASRLAGGGAATVSTAPAGSQELLDWLGFRSDVGRASSRKPPQGF